MNAALERIVAGAPYRFGNTSEGRMILDCDGHYFCYVHVEQAGGGAIGSVTESIRRDDADALLATLNELPAFLALAAAASGGDVKQAPGEAPQSGPKGNAQEPSTHSFRQAER